MPETSETLKKQLNSTNTALTPENIRIIQLLPAGHKLGEPAALFAKLELSRVEELKKMFAGRNGDTTNACDKPVQPKKATATKVIKEKYLYWNGRFKLTSSI
jgi:hypothetical protein